MSVPGYINVDVRPTRATDLVHDCKDLSVFPDESLAFVFSNAFFEHLYVPQRLPFLRDLHRTLRADGWAAFTGLPNFEEVARAYLERRQPGHVSPEFDLSEVYRYTHGAPEGRANWWLAQLHKGLLDSRSLSSLLVEAGFASHCVFQYCWGNEPYPVNIAFLASKAPKPLDPSQPEIRDLLSSLPANINFQTLTVRS